jgi:3-oxoacyl-[acyl-carrier protein] reductase
VVAADLIEPEQVQRVYDDTMREFGRMDILVNNVGVGKFGTLDVYSVEDYDWMFDANMKATFLVTRLFLPGMLAQKDGTLIFVGSVAGMRGLPGEAIYSASKNAQRAFAEALDHECRPHNVKVSYLAPGGVNSFFAYGTGRTPGDPRLEQMLDNEDVADAVIFAATQPPKSRAFLIGMRPMSEAL